MKSLFALVFAIALAFGVIPGAAPTLASAGSTIIINEVELNPPGSDRGTELVELYNPTENAIDVSEWSVRSNAGETSMVSLAGDTVIPAKGFLVVSMPYQWLDNVGETVELRDNLGNLIDSAGQFSDEDNDDASWQRSPDSSDNWVMSRDTLNQRNVGTFAPDPQPSPDPEDPELVPTGPDIIAPLGTLRIVFIDVGQGSSNLITLPNGKTMLIDGGEPPSSAAVLDALQENGVERLDLVVATHPHADHIGGLINVINTVDVGLVIDSGQIHTTQTFEDLLDTIEAKNIPLQSVKEGDPLPDLDAPVDLDVLNPPTTLPDGADDESEFNNNSVVIKLTYRNFTALFTGDMEEENESRLASQDVDADVLTAGHHGSRTASTAAFLEAASPEVVVISLGADNSYGHPHQEALDRIEAAGTEHVFRTDLDGTITLTTTGDGSYMFDTSRSDKTVVVPEFPAAMLVAPVALILLLAFSRGRIWKSFRLA